MQQHRRDARAHQRAPRFDGSNGFAYKGTGNITGTAAVLRTTCAGCARAGKARRERDFLVPIGDG
jgi:hypothetical protein